RPAARRAGARPGPGSSLASASGEVPATPGLATPGLAGAAAGCPEPPTLARVIDRLAVDGDGASPATGNGAARAAGEELAARLSAELAREEAVARTATRDDGAEPGRTRTANGATAVSRSNGSRGGGGAAARATATAPATATADSLAEGSAERPGGAVAVADGPGGGDPWIDAATPLFPLQPPRTGRELLADHVTAMVCCAAMDTAGATPGLDWLDGPALLVDGRRRADLAGRVLRLVEDGDAGPLRGWLVEVGVRPDKPVRLV
ncbi:hypothetical protein RKE29_29910, partial [Streptomyces sp. B1866]|nr:hypothetical protein [Streptomyces sp. B1866]